MAHGKAQCSLLSGIFAITAIAVGLAGCSGGDGVRDGTLRGWAYIADDVVIISASSVPPQNHEPLEDTRVTIEGRPDLEATTDADGHYRIADVPAGSREIVISLEDTEFRFAVRVAAGAVVTGTGHSQGGGRL